MRLPLSKLTALIALPAIDRAMAIRWQLWLCTLIITTMLAGSAHGEVVVSQIDYAGWTGAYQMTNGTVELVFVPQIGRIMRYGYVNGPDMLWNNPDLTGKMVSRDDAGKSWPNYGGDKLWPAPQDRWGWPPDPALDSAPPRVKILPNHHLLVTGQDSVKHGIRFTREISLAATGSTVTLRNTMRNIGDRSQIWAVWEVFQTNNPTLVRMPLRHDGRFPMGYYNFNPNLPAAATVHTDDMQLTRDPKDSYKLGTDSAQNQLEALISGQKFTISARYDSSGSYPDGGCAAEVWSNPDPLPYMELEMLGPIQTLAPGKTTSFTTRWNLSR